jgi:holo-[acyl-carrier protein] synthase
VETGVDIIEIERIRTAVARHGQRFLDRVFTPQEQRHCQGRAESLAARFATKEAAFKALGMRVDWRDVEVVCTPGGKPTLRLHGRAVAIAATMGATRWAVSLSHSRDYAVAVVIASAPGAVS